MGYRLNTHVHAVELDGDGNRTGREATFGPDSDLAAAENRWALSAITNPDVWDGDKPPTRTPAPTPSTGTGASDEVVNLRARIAELEASQAASTGRGAKPEVPPRGGPGSGAPEWRAYARSLDVEVADTASREDVIKALDAAGKTTE